MFFVLNTFSKLYFTNFAGNTSVFRAYANVENVDGAFNERDIDPGWWGRAEEKRFRGFVNALSDPRRCIDCFDFSEFQSFKTGDNSCPKLKMVKHRSEPVPVRSQVLRVPCGRANFDGRTRSAWFKRLRREAASPRHLRCRRYEVRPFASERFASASGAGQNQRTHSVRIVFRVRSPLHEN